MTDDVPPPMTAKDVDIVRHDVAHADHAVFLYATRDALLAALRAFLDAGLARGEVSVFVHGCDDEETAWRFVEEARPGSRRLADDRIVLVSLYREAFQGGSPHIDHGHVTRVVGRLLDDAREAGRRGVRLFVDASRHYLDEDRADEWFRFETWLGRRLQWDVALVCAYPEAHAMRSDVFPQVLRTHAYRFDAARDAEAR